MVKPTMVFPMNDYPYSPYSTAVALQDPFLQPNSPSMPFSLPSLSFGTLSPSSHSLSLLIRGSNKGCGAFKASLQWPPSTLRGPSLPLAAIPGISFGSLSLPTPPSFPLWFVHLFLYLFAPIWSSMDCTDLYHWLIGMGTGSAFLAIQ